MTTSEIRTARVEPSTWPLFGGRPEDWSFDILSIDAHRPAGSTIVDAGESAANLLTRAIQRSHDLAESELRLLRVFARGSENKSSALRAQKAGMWGLWTGNILPLPAGTRFAREWSADADGIHFGGEIRTDVSQLALCLEQTRKLTASCVIPISDEARSVDFLQMLFESPTDLDYVKPLMLRDFVPRATAAGGCVLRATGWFDDPYAGIDVFAAPPIIDILQASLAEIEPPR